LAALGGTPAFGNSLHVGRPNVGDRRKFARLVDKVLEMRCFTNEGPLLMEFEQRLANRLGVEHCIAISNSTTALMIALTASGVRGDVLMPSFTFPATPHAAQWVGLQPVFVDVDSATHTLDPRRVADAATPRLGAIVGVHVWGHACDVEQLERIAEGAGVPLLFDAAPAFDCSYRGRKIGNFGLAETMSFHATKVLTTFEGGAILTNDDDLAERARLMTRFGFRDEDAVVSLGINGKMNEVSAAMGLASLELVDDFIATNREHHRRYKAGLARLPGLRVLDYPEDETANYQYVVLEIDADVAPLSRDVLRRVLVAENVLARRYFYPGCHRMEPYRSEQPRAGERLPETEALVERVLQLPTGTALTADHVDRVCEIIVTAFALGEELSATLAARV
jgi:dTDP-4-amino-4,6-dideoxygalactose transaminase